MFLTAEQAKDKVKEIIADDIDNDIVFVVAQKGIGKTKILETVYNSVLYNDQLIAVDGKKIKTNAPRLKKCFTEGIIAYVLRNNSKETRVKLYENLGSRISQAQKFIIRFKRKIDIQTIQPILCDLSLNRLKNIYYRLAGGIPLVIVSDAMSLSEEEIRYLKELPNDSLGDNGARVTFVIGIRATPDNLTILDEVTKTKSSGIWLLPLLPAIINESSTSNPRSIPSISVEDTGTINNVEELEKKIFSNSVYFDTYEIVRHLYNKHWDPHNLYILANQEVSLKDYTYICDISKRIYERNLPQYDKRLMLPINGTLLWLDVLSYYLALKSGIDEAVNDTQCFFLEIIRELASENNRIWFGKPSRKAYQSFIKDAASMKENALAKGFARYYSDFAALARILFARKTHSNCFFRESMSAAEVLDRVVLIYSNENIEALYKIYEETQICHILDIGLEATNAFIQSDHCEKELYDKAKDQIANFLRICMIQAYKWHDVTLIDKMAELLSSIKAKQLSIKFRFDELTKDSDATGMYGYFMKALQNNNLKMEDAIMPKNTIFLSYTHTNSAIADGMDRALQDLGYDVKRDNRDAESWESLKEFMKSIRKEDYVVLLVSDSYLHRDNCMYEVMQFLRDESYERRAFPIVIDFTEDEKEQRSSDGQVTSMFSPEYTADIVIFWQDRAKELERKMKRIAPENRAELDAQYRDIDNMASTASVFLTAFFGNKLLEVINRDEPQYEDIATKIDKKIQERNDS